MGDLFRRLAARHRGWSKPKQVLFWLGVGFVTLMVIGGIGAAVDPPPKKVAVVSTTTTTSRPPTSTTERATSTRGTVAPTSPPTTVFPGQRKGDVIAGPDSKGVVTVGDWIVAGVNWSRDEVKGICGTVLVGYAGRQSEAHYGYSQWVIQTPHQATKGPNLFSDLGEGDVARGGRTQGTVCFPDQGEDGRYWVFFTGSSAGRAVWPADIS